MSEEIKKIITLGDIFRNIETEEKAFKFKDYIRDLQQKVEQLENIRKEAIEYVKSKEFAENFPYVMNECQVRSVILKILDKKEVNK